MPSQSGGRESTGVLEDIRFMSDQTVCDTLSGGRRNNHRQGLWANDCLYDIYAFAGRLLNGETNAIATMVSLECSS